MAEREHEVDPTPGLAGGPPGTPPGFGDNTPRPRRAEPETPPTPAPKPDEELDGEGLATPAETGTPGGVPRQG